MNKRNCGRVHPNGCRSHPTTSIHELGRGFGGIEENHHDGRATSPDTVRGVSGYGRDRPGGDSATHSGRYPGDDLARLRHGGSPVAAGLAAIGVGRGDTVTLMMANRIEFYPLEVGAQHVGATSFSVYNTMPAHQLAYVCDNAGTKVVMCEAQYVDRIRASGVPIEHIICVDDAPEGTVSVDDLIAIGSDDFDFDSVWRSIRPDDVATLVYTSGTTGEPKGVEMTHANLLFEVFGIEAVLGHRLRRSDDVVPALRAHRRSGRRAVQPGSFRYSDHHGGRSACHRVGTDGRAADRLGCRAASVGKIKGSNRIRRGERARRDDAAGSGVGVGVAAKKAAAVLAGRRLPDEIAAEWARADDTVLTKLRTKIGLDQLRWALSGAAPIPKETVAFFEESGSRSPKPGACRSSAALPP